MAVGLTQIFGVAPHELIVLVNHLVNSLVTYSWYTFTFETTGNLLGTVVSLQAGLNLLPNLGRDFLETLLRLPTAFFCFIPKLIFIFP